jgi:DNA invertase Pin-like site-specific DNA recombinase
MIFSISGVGAADEELRSKAHVWWKSTASNQGINVTGFNASASFDERVTWAISNGMEIGTTYSRYSTKLQSSTDDQVRENVQWAAKNGIYVPPELISVDEGVKGKSVRRSGLDRTKAILQQRLAKVLLVFKVSRLFRQAGKGYQFVNEEVVEIGLRAVSVSQGIDTNDRKTWKLQLQIHGIMDDMLLDAIADHVRSGLKGLFLKRWTTGAIGIGYRRKEIKDAPLTKLERPRTVPEVNPEAARLIQEHAKLLLDGMSIREGVRRWNNCNGPLDPRSTNGKISYNSYRRLFSNPRLIGTWEFGRRRNQFSSKLDSVRQIEQPDDDVESLHIEELRILEDETFHALQSVFNGKKIGPRGPRREKRLQLWDLTTEFFFCASCSQPEALVRMYQTGANGKHMHCKNGDQCKCKSALLRNEAVQAVCRRLTELISRDPELVELVTRKSLELDCRADEGLERLLEQAKRRLKAISNRVNDLFDLSGEGTERDRNETKARLKIAQSERNAVHNEVTRLQSSVTGKTNTLSIEAIRERLSGMSDLLANAASGELGEDAVYKTLAVFRSLTGGVVMVHVEHRTNRKHTNVRGTFCFQLVRTAKGQSHESDKVSDNTITVWLREPPRLDAIAQRVHELIDIERKSHRETAIQLRLEGHNVNSGNVWYSYRRWYEMQGIGPPKVPYNNGHKRISA